MAKSKTKFINNDIKHFDDSFKYIKSLKIIIIVIFIIF